MNHKKRFLSLLVLLSTVLIGYELLLTWQRTPLVTTRAEQRSVLNEPGYQPVGRRTLRQLLEDKDITELPVKIVTDCWDSRVTHSKYRNHIEKNRNQDMVVEGRGDSDIHILDNRELNQISSSEHQSHLNTEHVICLNETQLYRDSIEHYGAHFNELTDTQKKATIVRAVLKNLEHQDQVEIEDRIKYEYHYDSEHYVAVTQEKPVLKPTKRESVKLNSRKRKSTKDRSKEQYHYQGLSPDYTGFDNNAKPLRSHGRRFGGVSQVLELKHFSTVETVFDGERNGSSLDNQRLKGHMVCKLIHTHSVTCISS